MKYKHYLGYKKYKITGNSFITNSYETIFDFKYGGYYHRSRYIDGFIRVYRLELNCWRFKYKSKYTKPSTIGLILAALDYIEANEI